MSGDTIIKQLREENERLKKHTCPPMVYKDAVDDLQARLSAAEKARDENGYALMGAQQENERLKGHHDYAHHGKQPGDESPSDLQARLSLAEQESKWYREDRDRLQARLTASENEISRMHNDFAEELQRAEMVVEAAKAWSHGHRTLGEAQALDNALRRYEEGKKDVTPGPISDR